MAFPISPVRAEGTDLGPSKSLTRFNRKYFCPAICDFRRRLNQRQCIYCNNEDRFLSLGIAQVSDPRKPPTNICLVKSLGRSGTAGVEGAWSINYTNSSSWRNHKTGYKKTIQGRSTRRCAAPFLAFKLHSKTHSSKKPLQG